MRLEESGIRVAEYLTALPPRPLLERKLHDAVEVARRRLAAQAARILLVSGSTRAGSTNTAALPSVLDHVRAASGRC